MNQKILWIITGIAAVIIVAGAISVARNKPVPVAPVQVAISEVAEPAPKSEVIADVRLPEIDEPLEGVLPVQPEPKEAAPPSIDEITLNLDRIAGTMKVKSRDIPAGATQNSRYPLDLTCYRQNRSPAVAWSDAPEATKSYVLTLERRVAGEKAGWAWILFNIPAEAQAIPGHISPDTITEKQGVFGMNQNGNVAYNGPCEPHGVFLYVLRLFALDTVLSAEAGAKMEDLIPLMNGHIVDAAEIRSQHYLRM